MENYQNYQNYDNNEKTNVIINYYSENCDVIKEDTDDFSNCKIIKSFPQVELREIEQYFFTEDVIKNIILSLEYENNVVCLGTPAVADGFFRFKNRVVTLLDIDKRFDYLPGYTFYDILNPPELDVTPNVLVIDPPFFKMNLVDLYNCVEKITKGNKMTKIIFAFVQREERALLNVFKSYNLQLTKFKLEYRFVEPSKWSNYALYSNAEFNKIKFYAKDSVKKNLKGSSKRK